MTLMEHVSNLVIHVSQLMLQYFECVVNEKEHEIEHKPKYQKTESHRSDEAFLPKLTDVQHDTIQVKRTKPKYQKTESHISDETFLLKLTYAQHDTIQVKQTNPINKSALPPRHTSKQKPVFHVDTVDVNDVWGQFVLLD